MEVHAHTHTARKKFTHYLWEFLMLFLAVFCGFLAEYQLEHVIENQREEKYVQSLIQDLKTDTSNLQIYTDRMKEKRIMMDSLVMLLSTGKNKQLGNETYFFARHVFNVTPFVSTDGTMQQLKNAGNLRLIKNENIISYILDYDASVKDLKEWDESDIRIRTTFREIGGSVFNADQLYKAMDSNFKFVRPTTNPQLITDNLITINNVAFQIQYLSLSCLGNTQRGKALKTKAETLINLLKKEYHLK
jgi:protein associated with RNAse G/E